MTTPADIAQTTALRLPNLRLAKNTIAHTETVAPRLRDMTFPVIVINVIPIAVQPIKDADVSNDIRLMRVKRPGVVKAQDAMAIAAIVRMIKTYRVRRSAAVRERPPSTRVSD
jgi:hypothetical protein